MTPEAQTIGARGTDVAGNGPVASAGSLPITIDRAPPAVPGSLDLAAGDDSGSSSTDNITNDDSWQIGGSHGIGTSTVRVLLDAVLAGTASVDPGAAGSWSVPVDASSAAQGGRSVQAIAIDAAGNQSAAASLTVTRDTQLAAPSTPNLAAGSDSGASDTDNITNATTLTFTGTAEIGSTVEILVGGVSRASGAADGSGNYSVAVNMSGDTAGQTISARANDAAGNGPVASAGSLPITIDRTPPTVTAFVPSDAEVLETESGTLTLAFTYSEPMDTSVNPTISFDRNLSARLTAGPTFGWAGNTVTATYTLTAGGNDPADPITVTVGGAEDVAGNTQTSFDSNPAELAVSRSLLRTGSAGAKAALTARKSEVRSTPHTHVPAAGYDFPAPASGAVEPTPAAPAATRAQRPAPRPAAQAAAAQAAAARAPAPAVAPTPAAPAAAGPTTAAPERPSRRDEAPRPEPPASPRREAPDAPRPDASLLQPEPGAEMAEPRRIGGDGGAGLALLAACSAAGAALVAARIVRRRRGLP